MYKLANAAQNDVDHLHQKTLEYQHYRYRQGQQSALASHRRTARYERIPPDGFDAADPEATLTQKFPVPPESIPLNNETHYPLRTPAPANPPAPVPAAAVLRRPTSAAIPAEGGAAFLLPVPRPARSYKCPAHKAKTYLPKTMPAFYTGQYTCAPLPARVRTWTKFLPRCDAGSSDPADSPHQPQT